MNEEEELKSTNINVLQRIQSELKAPKGQRNSFGNYNYRSAEDILEAVKPILAKYGTALLSSDEVVEIKDRVYIKTTVALIKDGENLASVSAFAREALTKKGMDEAQITGSSASYSSKRALGNLLCISDSSLDPDATNTHGASKPTKTNKTQANKTQKDVLDDDWI
jgi:hypothetical protein